MAVAFLVDITVAMLLLVWVFKRISNLQIIFACLCVSTCTWIIHLFWNGGCSPFKLMIFYLETQRWMLWSLWL